MKMYRTAWGKYSDRFSGFFLEAENINLWDRIILWFQGHVKEVR